jgi:hypothetical protein
MQVEACFRWLPKSYSHHLGYEIRSRSHVQTDNELVDYSGWYMAIGSHAIAPTYGTDMKPDRVQMLNI